jgi:hypothetical protein
LQKELDPVIKITFWNLKAAVSSVLPMPDVQSFRVAIIDSYKAFDTNSLAKLTVQIHYLKPLYYEDYKDMKTVEIADTVSQMIQKTIKEYETI